MLEYLRNAADKPLAKFLMFVLIFSFVGWGAAEWIFGSSTRDTTLLTVGGADVPVHLFNNERSRQLSEMTKEEQRAVYTDPAKSSALINSVMSKITVNQLALNRAKDLGFVVSDEHIINEIKSQPEYQSDGVFSPWMFQVMVQSAGITEHDIADAMRKNMLREMVIGVTDEKVAVPSFAVDAAYNARYAKRDVDYTTVLFSNYKVGQPKEEQLRAYYEQNPQSIPETRSVSYVFLAADMAKPDVYDEKFKTAQQIEDMIISGDSLKKAADKHHAKYVAIKDVKRGEKLSDKILSDDLVAKLFSMESGSESELLELKDGFVILRVDDVVPQHNAAFDDVKNNLINGWKKSEQRKLAYVDANEKLIAMKKGETIKGLKNANVTRTEGAPLVVLNSAFAGHDGDSILTEDDKAFYIVHVGKNVMPKPDKKRADVLRKELENLSTRFVLDDYTQFLKREYPVKVNQKTYDRFIAK